VVLLPMAIAEFEKWRAAPSNENADERVMMSQSVETLLRTLVQRARLPRRMAERCRSLLLSQRTLAGWRRRRGGLGGFRQHPMFAESLKVFEVWHLATQAHADTLEAWKSGRAPTPAADASGPRRRRRRSGSASAQATKDSAPPEETSGDLTPSDTIATPDDTTPSGTLALSSDAGANEKPAHHSSDQGSSASD
jgi:poly(A) polymerase